MAFKKPFWDDEEFLLRSGSASSSVGSWWKRRSLRVWLAVSVCVCVCVCVCMVQGKQNN